MVRSHKKPGTNSDTLEGLLTATTQSTVALTVNTAVEGFSVIQTLAQIADVGWGGLFVHLMTATDRVAGYTIGIVDYTEQVGLDTTKLKQELGSEPRADPQHLHLLCPDRTGDSASLRRVRITDVEYCLMNLRSNRNDEHRDSSLLPDEALTGAPLVT
jgi:hypothetical protein